MTTDLEATHTRFAGVDPGREAVLTKELETSRKENEALRQRLEDQEQEKTVEAAHLEKMAAKLERVRQQQAKKISGLQSLTERQKAVDLQKESQLNAAKDILVGSRNKQLRVRMIRWV